jgi:hypothetical protein
LYASPYIIRVIKARKMRWAGHVARMRAVTNAYEILVGKPEGKRPLGRPGVDGMIILELFLGKYGGRVWTGFIWFRIGTSEHGSKLSGSIEGGESNV